MFTNGWRLWCLIRVLIKSKNGAKYVAYTLALILWKLFIKDQDEWVECFVWIKCGLSFNLIVIIINADTKWTLVLWALTPFDRTWFHFWSYLPVIIISVHVANIFINFLTMISFKAFLTYALVTVDEINACCFVHAWIWFTIIHIVLTMYTFKAIDTVTFEWAKCILAWFCCRSYTGWKGSFQAAFIDVYNRSKKEWSSLN